MYDNICKYLIQTFSTDFATWLLGEPVSLIELKPTELSSEPIRADSIVLLQSTETILHIEFQTRPDPDMPFRMLDYCVRIYRRFPNKKLRQVVIYLKPTQSQEVYRDTFELPRTRHEFDIVRLWEQPSSALLSSPGLLPLAVLASTDDRVAMLRQVSTNIQQTEDAEMQKNLMAAADILAGLVLDKEIIRKILRTDLMQESVTYQAIKQEGREEGKEEGAHLMALQMLAIKLGDLPEAVTAQVQQLSLAQLPALGLATPGFESVDDLALWLQSEVS